MAEMLKDVADAGSYAPVTILIDERPLLTAAKQSPWVAPYLIGRIIHNEHCYPEWSQEHRFGG
jgi:hypothetical protein